MPEQHSSGNRNVTARVVLISAVVVICGLAAAIIAHVYFKGAMWVVSLPMFLVVFILLNRMPAQSLKMIGDAIQKQEQSEFGRFMKTVKYILWGLLGVGLVQWLLGKL